MLTSAVLANWKILTPSWSFVTQNPRFVGYDWIWTKICPDMEKNWIWLDMTGYDWICWIWLDMRIWCPDMRICWIWKNGWLANFPLNPSDWIWKSSLKFPGSLDSGYEFRTSKNNDFSKTGYEWKSGWTLRMAILEVYTDTVFEFDIKFSSDR